MTRREVTPGAAGGAAVRLTERDRDVLTWAWAWSQAEWEDDYPEWCDALDAAMCKVLNKVCRPNPDPLPPLDLEHGPRP